MAEQLPLFPAPPPCTATLADLVLDLGPAPTALPLWAEVCGEVWFQREWERCVDDWTMASLASRIGGAFGVRVAVARTGHWNAGCRERHGSPCCAEAIRDALGPVTLAMLREGLRRRGRDG